MSDQQSTQLVPDGPLYPDGTPMDLSGLHHGLKGILNSAGGIINGILMATKPAQEIQARQFKEKLERDKVENEKANQKAEIDFRHKQLDQENTHFGLAQKAAKALQDVQTALAKQQIAANIQAGIPVPGSTVTHNEDSQGGIGDSAVSIGDNAQAFLAKPDAMKSYSATDTHTLPFNDENGKPVSVTVDNETVAAGKKANLERITSAPKEEAKTREELALQRERNAQSEANKQSDFARMMLERAFENARNKETIASHERIAKMDNDSRERIARIAHQMGIFGTLDPEQIKTIANPYLEGLSNGTMSAAQIKKDFSEKGLVGGDTAILASFMGTGRVPPNDNQVKFVQNVKPIVDSLPLIQQYISMLPKTSSGLGGAFTGLTHPDLMNPQLESKLKEIEFNIATVAKNLSGDQGQRLQKALLKPAEGGYLPDKFKSTGYNVNNFNKLIDVLNSAIDSSLGSLTPEHRAHIKENMGLSGISRLHQNGSPVRGSSPTNQENQTDQNNQTQPGATHIWTPQGIQPVGGQGPQTQDVFNLNGTTYKKGQIVKFKGKSYIVDGVENGKLSVTAQ